MTEHEIELALRSYLLSRGMELSPEAVEEDCIHFQDGDSKVLVKVVSRKQLGDRNALLEAVLKATDLTRKANKVYIALPRIYASILDCSTLEKQGLGLLTYDERRVEEALMPKRFELTRETSMTVQVPSQFFEELDHIKRRFHALEETVEALREEVRMLRSIGVQRPEFRVEPQPVEVTVPKDLPSFFKDNPWVDVLSRRGREPEKVAG